MKKLTVTRFDLIALLVCGVVLFAMGGCGDNEFAPVGNQPPETGLAITGNVDTTFYRIDMKWWGSDPDGDVVGYQYRWIAPPGEPVFDLDTVWTFTGFAKKRFYVPVADSSATYTFEVRAVDDRGAVDETPATQSYPFYNHPPFGEIRFKDHLPDSSWPVIALSWDSYDPDGDSTIAANLLWVKGQEDNPIELPGDVDTIIINPTQLDASGDVTIYFQTVDQGYAAGPLDSFDIYLWDVKGSVLLVDDYNKSNTLYNNPDKFYKDLLTARYGEDGYTVLNLARRPFDTDVRFEAFLAAFDQVIWYSGNRQRARLEDPDRFAQMSLADSIMGLYIGRDGGDLFLSSLNAVGTFGGFSEEFQQDILGVDQLYVDYTNGSTSHDFRAGASPCTTATMLAVEGSGFPDLVLGCGVPFPSAPLYTYKGIDSPDTTADIGAELLYRLPAGVLKNQVIIVKNGATELVDSFFVGDSLIATDTLVTVDDTVGVGFYPALRRELPSGGKVAVFQFPFDFYFGDARNNEEVFDRVLDWFEEIPRRR